MNEKNLKSRKTELKSIWKSLEPCIKQHLTSIDSILLTIYTEARTFGVPKPMIEEYVNERFWELAREVSEA